MTQAHIDLIKGLVRPAMTLLIVGGFVAGAFADTGAADIVKDPALMILAFWFGERNAKRPAPSA